MTLRRKIYLILEQGSVRGSASLSVNTGLICAIVVSLLATISESVPELAHRHASGFQSIEVSVAVIFCAEYLARVWTAAEHAPWRRFGALGSRLRFMGSLAGIIDLAAILPLLLTHFAAPELKTLLVLRLVRFLKLTRYSPAINSLLEALYVERRALTGCFVILLGAALIAAGLMHLAESTVQPDKFGTIPDALWWAIVTLGTVGYGDVVPITAIGRLIAGCTIFAGLLMVALPVGIVATAFANEVHRRDFIITWSLVAKIPLFSELSAVQIGEIMKMLRAQKLDAGSVVTRRGEPAHSMYLIADGEVEIKLRHNPVRLGAGHFFGEIAVLRRAHRSATVIATQTTRLLVLDAADLHGLMDREPGFAARIEEAAREKLGRELEAPAGDLVREEVASGLPAGR
ncbi:MULTISPECIES: cyclic nucleotide-gated ion channel [unclassified Bradyrhizobium]